MGTPGSYLLLLELGQAKAIRVGRLGTFDFPQGWYVYVGSALAGLEQRASRHLRPALVQHWHLDYLRAEAPVREVHLFPSSCRQECDLARVLLSLPGASIPAPRFGASDCRCPAHLVHFEDYPALEAVFGLSRRLFGNAEGGEGIKPPNRRIVVPGP